MSQHIQQFEVIPLSCNKPTHETNSIQSICLRVGCNEQCAQCHTCLIELHKDCIHSSKMVKDLPQLVQPFYQMQSHLIDLQQKMNQLMKELIDSIEKVFQPIQQYNGNPNLTNLNQLGLFLKQENKWNIGNNIEKLEKDIKKIIEDCKERIKFQVSIYEQIIWKKNNKKSTEWFNEGYTLNNLGKYQEAIDCYQQAININPKYSLAWNNKGLALNNLGKYQEAIDCCQQAINIDPQNSYAWNNKGNALNNLGKYQEAIDCYQQAININPQNSTAIENIQIAKKALKK